MRSDAGMTRRAALGVMAGSATLLAGASATGQSETPLKANLRQSVCKWCYPRMSLDELASNAARIGLKSVELLDEKDWATVQKHGLTCAMANGPSGISHGWNRPQDHDKLVAESERLLPLCAEAGIPNMIVFSGNRDGLPDGEGVENCATGLKRILRTAERQGVTVCMELLNSKVDHKDYQCDHTPWGVALVDTVGSDRFKLLYDIYHMQIMEGDVIRTIQTYKDYFAHYHTGGVPGRHEIDDTQELNYGAICRAIVDTGFEGYLAQEFIPSRDPMTSLAEAARICDV